MMVWDSSEKRAGGRDNLTPMQIAHHPLFTAREKIDLLQKLKAEVTGALQNGDDLGLSPAEIDDAIEEVKLGAQRGEQSETVLRGDN
jgi:hypothetical protein